MCPSLLSRIKGRPALPILAPCDIPANFSWASIFEHGDRRVEIEIGTGRGGFLEQAATLAPETNFLGIDIAYKYLCVAAHRLHREGCHNVALFGGMFETLLGELPENSVSAVHIYFPDPWHKKRHVGRRMLRPETLHWFHRLLLPGGEIRVRTDVAPYFDDMLAALREADRGFALDAPLRYISLPREDWLPTNYERRFLADGLTCHAVTARKRPA